MIPPTMSPFISEVLHADGIYLNTKQLLASYMHRGRRYTACTHLPPLLSLSVSLYLSFSAAEVDKCTSMLLGCSSISSVLMWMVLDIKVNIYSVKDPGCFFEKLCLCLGHLFSCQSLMSRWPISNRSNECKWVKMSNLEHCHLHMGVTSIRFR